MKKVLFVVLLFVVLCIPVFATDFYDLPRDNSEKSQAVYKLADAGIVGGYENGTFRPNNQLTRAELCKIVNLIFDFTTPATANFNDVKDTDWFYGHVLVAKQAGYINGFENNTFRGNANLTREQTCAIISRVVGLDLPANEVKINDKVSDWAKNDVLKVIANGIMPIEENGVFRATENITRVELCMALAHYVKINESESTKNLYTAEELNDQAKKYVGEITCFDKSGNAISIGTGFVYTESGNVITNYHVIDDAYSAKIVINGNEFEIMSVLGYDEHIDLAVLKINGNKFYHATLAENESVTGNTVYAIGSSRGLTNTFSKGIITYSNRIIDGVSYIQHDASITNGNSGGPLINEFGDVIGVNTWGVDNSQNLNFAVSVSEFENISLNNSMTLAQLYNSKLTVYDILIEWLLKNYNYSGENYVCFNVDMSKAEIFSLTYYTADKRLAIDCSILFNNKDNRYVSLDLDEYDSAYYYAAYANEKEDKNITEGYIDKKSFKSSTSLSYSKSEGGNWTMDSLLDTYQEGIVFLLGFFDKFLDSYFPNLVLKDFGYNSFVTIKWEPYQVVEDDFTKLKNYVVGKGTYDSEICVYILKLNSFYHVEETEFYHYVIYDTKDGTIDLISILYDKLFDHNYILNVSMSDFYGQYNYYYIGQHMNSDFSFTQCEMSGTISAMIFNYSNKNFFIDYHSLGNIGLTDCRSWCALLLNSICCYLDSYFSPIGITAEDMGFSNY